MEKIDIGQVERPIRLSANSILSAGDLPRQIAMIVASSFADSARLPEEAYPTYESPLSRKESLSPAARAQSG